MNRIVLMFLFFSMFFLFQVDTAMAADCTLNQTIGKYNVIDCNNGTSIHVFQEETSNGLFAVIILLPIILGFLLMQWANNISEEHNTIRLLVYLSPIPLFFISVTFASIILGQYYAIPELLEEMGDTVYIFGLIFFVIVAYYVFHIIKYAIEKAAQKKQEKLNY